MSSFNLLKDLSLLQTQGGVVRSKLNILWTEGNKCCLWKMSKQILAAHSIVLDTSAGFSFVLELKNYLKTSSSAMKACVSGDSLGNFVTKWPTHSLRASFFVLNITYCHLMIDAVQFTECKYAYRLSAKILFNQQTEIYRLTRYI